MRRIVFLCLAVAVFTLALRAGVSVAAVIPRENADVDQNNVINSGDLLLVVLGTHPRADVNRDGRVNSGDALYVLQSYGPLPRDKYRQPFSSDSPWNTAIGSGAQYGDTGFAMTRDYTVIDVDHWVLTTPADPVREVINDQATWSGPRCSAAVASGKLTSLPDSLLVPDVSGGNLPNNPAAILQPDGRTIVQVNALARCVAGGPVYGVPAATVDIYGKGIPGGHGGSGLSSIGGTVRLGELLGGSIKHAMKVNIPCALYCSPASGPGGGPGWRWPAYTSDQHCGSYACGYGGTRPALQMGSLLALPANLNQATVTAPGQSWPPGMETEVGRRLFYAFQNYGAYVVDDLVWNGTAYAIHVERGVRQEVLAASGIDIDNATPACGGVCGAYWRDWHRIWLNLKVVTNNGPTSVGGGGSPRVPKAPPIGN
ncbi:MAG: hypothetical protein HY873_08445 [Chloroflexi bacterium]|nr:hypothetical protein [Chloroflexota bacterium]